MTTRPRKPAPGTPAPGKLPLTELAEMKARRQPIAMVTAYDAPSRPARRRGRRRPDPRRRLGRDDRARPRLDRARDDGRDDRPHARRHARRAAAARRRRHAVRVVPGLRRGGDARTRSASSRRRARTPSSSRAPGRRSRACRRSSARGIPVMGHLGLTPQSATMLGGFKAQGRTAEKAVRLFEDALALEAAGCFAIVLEAVPAPVAARITEALTRPDDRHRRRRATATARCSSGTTCSGSTRATRRASSSSTPTSPPRSSDARRRLRRGRPRAPVPGGAAHVRDAGGGAGALRGGA